MSSQTNKCSISFIILAYNEEKHIERCIKSILPVTNKIYIIDSYSTDATVEIAKRNGATVLQNSWKNYATQYNWGIDNANIDTEWIMRLDSDEYLSTELQKELIETLPKLSKDITGLILNYRHYFWGKWIKHGTRYPIPLLRIFRTGIGRIENKWMDERIILSEGTTQKLKSDFIHDDLNDITFFTDKHNGYATREAIDLLNKQYHFMEEDNAKVAKSHFNLFIKNKFYSGSFLFVRCIIYFIYRYIFRLGFLDGKAGFVYHFLQGFWYRFLVDAKIYEWKRKFDNDPDKLIQYLKDTYGA